MPKIMAMGLCLASNILFIILRFPAVQIVKYSLDFIFYCAMLSKEKHENTGKKRDK